MGKQQTGYVEKERGPQALDGGFENNSGRRQGCVSASLMTWVKAARQVQPGVMVRRVQEEGW